MLSTSELSSSLLSLPCFSPESWVQMGGNVATTVYCRMSSLVSFIWDIVPCKCVSSLG